MLQHKIRCLSAAVAITLTASTGSFADFQLCNGSDVQMSIAVGYLHQDHGWSSSGWWTVESGNCVTAFHGKPLREYFLYAVDLKGRNWLGEEGQKGGWFCTSKDKFTFRNRDYVDKNKEIHCEDHGWKGKRFLLHDTGNKEDEKAYLTAKPSDPPYNNPPQTTPTVQPQPSSPTLPSEPSHTSEPQVSDGGGAACQRFPNLC